jgi:hypothetical protein
VHANLTPFNGGDHREASSLIGARELKMMKNTAILVSVARGPHISEDALIDALNAGEIRAAGLDVTETEPVIKPGLLELIKKGVVSAMPHIGSGTPEVRRRLHTIKPAALLILASAYLLDCLLIAMLSSSPRGGTLCSCPLSITSTKSLYREYRHRVQSMDSKLHKDTWQV